MPLAMNREVVITCAATGAGATRDRPPHMPRSRKAIADSAIAQAGAAALHCHMRDLDNGAPARRPDPHRELTGRIRGAETDAVLNPPPHRRPSAASLARDPLAAVAATVPAAGNMPAGGPGTLCQGQGRLAQNAQLAEQAVRIAKARAARVPGLDDLRHNLGLTSRAPVPA